MILYRLSKERYKLDLSGIGAEIHGGRWNNKGTRLIYTADSRALAKLEVAVHVNFRILPKNYFITTIEVPDKMVQMLDESMLMGEKWKSNPPINFTQKIGDLFVKEEKALALKVPSAVVEDDFNVLLNPRHQGFDKVKIVNTKPFNFDDRLFKF